MNEGAVAGEMHSFRFNGGPCIAISVTIPIGCSCPSKAQHPIDVLQPMSAFANFSPYTASPEENRGAYQPIGDGPSQTGSSSIQGASSAEEGRGAFDAYETSTQLPYEIEAALAYLLGCVSGIP